MFNRIRNALIRRLPSYKNEAEQLREFAFDNIDHIVGNSVIVEAGSGITTPVMAEIGRRTGAKVYSCDSNEEKIKMLKSRLGEELGGC